MQFSNHTCLCVTFVFFLVLFLRVLVIINLSSFMHFCFKSVSFWCDVVKVKVNFTLKQAMRPRWGVTVELYCFLNLGPRWEWMVNAVHQLLSPQEFPLYRRLGGSQRVIWMGVENLNPTGIWFPNRAANGESLYWLNYRWWVHPKNLNVFVYL